MRPPTGLALGLSLGVAKLFGPIPAGPHKAQGPELTIYYELSTWNPYVVVLMKSRLHVD
jgi:hypothetical protein